MNQPIDLVYNHILGVGHNWPRDFGAEVLSAKLILEADRQRKNIMHSRVRNSLPAAKAGILFFFTSDNA